MNKLILDLDLGRQNNSQYSLRNYCASLYVDVVRLNQIT